MGSGSLWLQRTGLCPAKDACLQALPRPALGCLFGWWPPRLRPVGLWGFSHCAHFVSSHECKEPCSAKVFLGDSPADLSSVLRLPLISPLLYATLQVLPTMDTLNADLCLLDVARPRTSIWFPRPVLSLEPHPAVIQGHCGAGLSPFPQ